MGVSGRGHVRLRGPGHRPGRDGGHCELDTDRHDEQFHLRRRDQRSSVRCQRSLAQYIALVGNTIQGTTGYDILLGYNTQYLLAEGNSIQNNTGLGFYAKTNNSNWSVRANTGTSGNTGSLIAADGYSPAANSIEVCWNLYDTSGGGWLVGPDLPGPIGPLWSNRNTWVIGAHTLSYDSATLTVVNDVVQFSGTANSHGWSIINSGSFTSSSFTGEDAVGAGPFVDSSGNLTGSYTSLLGTRGYQVG